MTKRLLAAACALAYALLTPATAEARHGGQGAHRHHASQHHVHHRRHRRAYHRDHGHRLGQRTRRDARVSLAGREGVDAVTFPVRLKGQIVSINTDAGITIRVAASVADQMRGFIADLVAQSYRPRQIHCAASGGHVRNSNHYWGGACDFDQRGWGVTARPMYRVSALAAKWGLRDGCTFRDCGHVDVPRNARRRIAAVR